MLTKFMEKKLKKKFIDNIHKVILQGVKPNITFILKVDAKKALEID